MRIVAIIAVRNEALYLERCIRHLVSEGVEICLIDNGSTDGTLDIAASYRNEGVMRIEDLPYTGSFELEVQCRLKERLARDISSDWFLHQDADEIRQSDNWNTEKLIDAVSDLDRHGFNAVNFDEFVFLPTSPEENFEGLDYVDLMRSYYYYHPAANRRVNMWKKPRDRPVDLTTSGGHAVDFEGRRIANRSFVLRHYIALSEGHAYRKYGVDRSYAAKEIANRKWHVERETWKSRHFRFPTQDELKVLAPGRPFDTSAPTKRHIFWHEQVS
ncbi:MAG: glycosyltransferase family 2 protein [Mesorhizobium sp.]|nr:glycosyltransferase family 2 protein [Mesorhizobium sp.]